MVPNFLLKTSNPFSSTTYLSNRLRSICNCHSVRLRFLPETYSSRGTGSILFLKQFLQWRMFLQKGWIKIGWCDMGFFGKIKKKVILSWPLSKSSAIIRKWLDLDKNQCKFKMFGSSILKYETWRKWHIVVLLCHCGIAEELFHRKFAELFQFVPFWHRPFWKAK